MLLNALDELIHILIVTHAEGMVGKRRDRGNRQQLDDAASLRVSLDLRGKELVY